MSELVGFVGMSHAPFATMSPPSSATAPGAQFLKDTIRVADAVQALAPDAIVVVGPDHFHGSFYDVMPPFVIGVEAAEGFGDFDSLAGPLPIASDLAWVVRDRIADAGFDLALSYSLTVDHGIVQSWDMVTGHRPVPLVPVVLNTAAPPLPSLARCAEFGAALGQAIRGWDSPAKVLLVASGGLSHWLPTNDPRELPAERREPLIHGRADTRAFAAVREPRVRAMGGNPDAPVNVAWDTWFLDQLQAGDIEPVVALGHEGLEAAAGTGGHEIRSWLVGMAAVRQPLVWTSYEPVPEWITGMGIGTTFEVR
jgi:2,3-dihydroxyphenylpropionate 1,2-dioxygenase